MYTGASINMTGMQLITKYTGGNICIQTASAKAHTVLEGPKTFQLFLNI